MTALASAVAGARLLRTRRPGSGWALAASVTAAQVLALSSGPVAYRLVAGPFLALFLTPVPRVRAGADVHLLLVLGDGNLVPPGISVNLAALLILLVVGASWQHDGRCAPAS